MARTDKATGTVVHRIQPLVVIAHQQAGGLEDVEVALLQQEAADRGWRLLDLCVSQRIIGDPPPDGAIIAQLPNDATSLKLRATGCPMVRVGRAPLPEDREIPAIVPDYREAGRMAVDYFAERGFRNVAVVGHESMLILPPMVEGISERALAWGCTWQEHLFRNIERKQRQEMDRLALHEHRMRQITEWIKSMPKPFGVIVCTNTLAAGICVNCQLEGMAVPEEVAVLAIGDRPGLCELAPVPVSAIDMNQEGIYKMGMSVLDDLMQGQSVPARTFVQPRGIVTRRSTDILAVDHPTVAHAIRFIWDHLDQNLSVDDVARQMHTPRYKLERMFRQYLHRGINTELRRIRMERFREMLRTTDLTVEQLAPQVGFNTPNFLHRTFRKTFGMTPRQYRLQSRRASAGSPDTMLAR